MLSIYSLSWTCPLAAINPDIKPNKLYQYHTWQILIQREKSELKTEEKDV
ncbi:hypothetical protein LguiA_003960 [Lonicera macranthoides]